MKQLRVFVLAVMAGVCIGIGGTASLSVENRIIGSLLFSVGLFTICTFGLALFTGRVCYAPQNGAAYALQLGIIWLGNLCGTFLTAFLEGFTRIGPALAERAAEICRTKLSDGLLSIFLLAVFCNMLIYIAVEGFRENPHPLGKYLALFFGVTVFVACGFEHCVANMYYFSIAGVWSGRTVLYLLVMTLGNAAGGMAMPLLLRFARGKQEKA